MTINQSTLCSVEGCEKTRVAKGYCMNHYCRNRKAMLVTMPTASTHLSGSDNLATEPSATSPMPIPFPGFEDFPSGEYDERAFAKTMANLATQLLNESPGHPNRKKIKEMIER